MFTGATLVGTGNSGCVDGARRRKSAAKALNLRIRPILVTWPTAKVRLTRKQKLFKPFGTTEGVHRFQCFKQGARTKLERAMTMEMKARHQHREIAIFVRHAETLTQFAH